MTGDCYPAALHTLFELGDGELCHGLVTGTGGEALGQRYGHAWVELDGWVHDRSNGHDLFAPRAWYYAKGTIDPDDVDRYTLAEASLMAVTYEHYGPWHDDTEEAAA